MTDIELAVSFVALLCGLLLANVANNLADALRSRHDLPIGFVPWAINFYITVAVINLFSSVAGVDFDWSSFGTPMIINLCLVAMPYVMVSRLLYPEYKDRWASIEEYYLANRKLILGLMLVPPISYALSLTYYTPELVVTGPILLLNSAPTIAIFVALLFAEQPKWHRVGWGFLAAHRVALMVWLALATG